MWHFPEIHRINILHFVFFGVLMMRFVTSCDSCGPGHTGLKRSGPSKKYLTKALREKQFLPNVDEYSLKASGRPEGKILRKSKRFNNLLVRVNSPNIVFRDEERTGADRYMTRRCKEKLEILAVMVRNEWPSVKLYVTEAFDENYAHKKQSLHYEGRALDIKTDDRDRKKYGTLARLAVQAGFDWVYYESKAHIHVSCRSEMGEFQRHMKDERCFHADSSTVVRKIPHLPDTTETIALRDLQIGDQVLATDPSGLPVFSEMIAWIDADLTSESFFLRVSTANGRQLVLTPSHLIHVQEESGAMTSRFAGDLLPGDSLMTFIPANGSLIRYFEGSKISAIGQEVSVGSLAPLTREGTIVVNKISASCYAMTTNTDLAHAAFAPLRWWTSLFGVAKPKTPGSGMHPYAKLLTFLSKFVLPTSFFSSAAQNRL